MNGIVKIIPNEQLFEPYKNNRCVMCSKENVGQFSITYDGNINGATFTFCNECLRKIRNTIDMYLISEDKDYIDDDDWK